MSITAVITTGGTAISASIGTTTISAAAATSASYVALLTQSGTNAPTPVVLANGLSVAPVWTRLAMGTYRATATGVFTANKTFVQCDVVAGIVGGEFKADGVRTSANTVDVYVRDPGGNLIDGVSPLYVRITVYT